MLKEEINIQGALFEYSVSNNSIERINSTDRLEEELVLQVTLWWSVRLCFNHVSELQWLSTQHSLLNIEIMSEACMFYKLIVCSFVSLLRWLCMGNLYNPDVRYSFHVPVEDTSDLFTWEHMDHDKTVPKCVKVPRF